MQPLNVRTWIMACTTIAVVRSLAAQAPELRVIRHTPVDTASAGSIVSVVFDRPITGMMGNDVLDPARFVRIRPALEGTFRWRDPATMQFIPARAFAPGDSFQVTVDTTFGAMDGARLATPYRFVVRRPGPRVLTARAVPLNPNDSAVTTVFRLLVSGPLDSATLARLGNGARLQTRPACRATGSLHVVSQELASENDRETLLGGSPAPGDTFRRVITFVPEHPLGDDCAGYWFVPPIDTTVSREPARYAFATRPAFAVRSPYCGDRECSENAIPLRFSTPVAHGDLERAVTITPAVPVRFVANHGEYPPSVNWRLSGPFAPGVTYLIRVSSSLRDIYGRALGTDAQFAAPIPNRAPSLAYNGGLSSAAPGHITLRVRQTSLDTLVVIVKPVPARLRLRLFTTPGLAPALDSIADSTVLVVPTNAPRNDTRDITLNLPHAGNSGDLLAVRVIGFQARKAGAPPMSCAGRNLPAVVYHCGPLALFQPTNLVVHARVGDETSVMFVTSATTGRPVDGATVTLRTNTGAVIAQGVTSANGTATLRHLAALPRECFQCVRAPIVEAEYHGDRVVWGVPTAFMAFRRDAYAATLFTDRGIYRPGETVHLEGIVRTGQLGAFAVPRQAPARIKVYALTNTGEDSVHTNQLTTSAFGTVVDSFALRAGAPLGDYSASLEIQNGKTWESVADVDFRVGEYRAPEFSVTTTTDSATRLAGDSIRLNVDAEYLFGAPMAGAPVQWTMTGTRMGSWASRIPHTEGYTIAPWSDAPGGARIPAQRGVDTTGNDGRSRIAVLPNLDSVSGLADLRFDVAVTDANRQVITRSTNVRVAATSFFFAVRNLGRVWYWQPGNADSIDVMAVRPNGDRVAKVNVDVYLLRRAYSEARHAWGIDTITTSRIVTDSSPTRLRFTPRQAGDYQIVLMAMDEHGRRVQASLDRRSIGDDVARVTVDSTTRLTLLAPTDTLGAGQVATAAYVNPFPRAEAWITIEREHVVEQRRATVRRGAQAISIPIKAEWAPNVFVSVVLVNQGSAYATDSLPALVREGRTELAVSRDARRLDVSIRPRRAPLAPGEEAVMDVQLSDHGRPVRGEATLWAADEGVLALTDYATPNPLQAMYARRGVGSLYSPGLRSRAAGLDPWSLIRGRSEGDDLFMLNEVVVSTTASSDVASASGAREAAVPPSAPRSNFQTTAFYLGQVAANAQGRAEFRARVPDNLTTFRVMAVAVTDDHFGAATDSLLVTRSVVVRPSLPRFLRPGDSAFAGATINVRNGVPQPAALGIAASHVVPASFDSVHVTATSQAHEARWSFSVLPHDTASSIGFRFAGVARDGSDVVDVRLPVRPATVPRSHTIAGAVRGATDIEFQLPADVDPERSRIAVERAGSPIGVLKWAFSYLRVYEYDCTEQLASTGYAMIAAYQARAILDSSTLKSLFGNQEPRAAIERIVNELSNRQRPDGSIAYWRDTEWSTPWLNVHAGLFLLEAKDAGIPVQQQVINNLASYSRALLDRQPFWGDTLSGLSDVRRIHLQRRLADRVAAASFLARIGSPHLEEERRLTAAVDRMAWEDRVRLAQVIAPRNAMVASALLDSAWASVRVAGRRIDLPDSSASRIDFPSRVRPAARLLSATLALQPAHPLLGALAETILQLTRAESGWSANTQDYAWMIGAIVEFDRGQAAVARKGLSVFGANAPRRAALALPGADSASLAGLVVNSCRTNDCATARVRVPLHVVAGDSATPLYFAVTITEVPRERSTTADNQGMIVERWYERFGDRTLTATVNEGDLVRVHLRVTVPSDRQFVVVDDALPAGLEAVDLTLRTSGTLGPFTTPASRPDDRETEPAWGYGRWDTGWWSPWEHREVRDDRVVYSARMVWKGTYEMSYIARATTAGTFVAPPASAEEMYNPALEGRSVGTLFTVRAKP